MRVLVVEDDEDLRIAVSAGLRTAALAVDSVLFPPLETYETEEVDVEAKS